MLAAGGRGLRIVDDALDVAGPLSNVSTPSIVAPSPPALYARGLRRQHDGRDEQGGDGDGADDRRTRCRCGGCACAAPPLPELVELAFAFGGALLLDRICCCFALGERAGRVSVASLVRLSLQSYERMRWENAPWRLATSPHRGIVERLLPIVAADRPTRVGSWSSRCVVADADVDRPQHARPSAALCRRPRGTSRQQGHHEVRRDHRRPRRQHPARQAPPR